jgi:hypothetical protein
MAVINSIKHVDPICKLSKFHRKPTLYLTREFRLLSVTAANKRVISKKLVTAYAAIWTVSLPMIISAYYKVTPDNTPTRKELTAIARFANAVPWRLAHREKFATKAPGHVNGGSAPPTLSAYTRWPLGCNNIFRVICPLAPGKVCGSTVTNSWFIGIKIFNQEGL